MSQPPFLFTGTVNHLTNSPQLRSHLPTGATTIRFHPLKPSSPMNPLQLNGPLTIKLPLPSSTHTSKAPIHMPQKVSLLHMILTITTANKPVLSRATNLPQLPGLISMKLHQFLSTLMMMYGATGPKNQAHLHLRHTHISMNPHRAMLLTCQVLQSGLITMKHPLNNCTHGMNTLENMNKAHLQAHMLITTFSHQQPTNILDTTQLQLCGLSFTPLQVLIFTHMTNLLTHTLWNQILLLITHIMCGMNHHHQYRLMNQHHHITQDGKLDHGTISMKLQLFNFSHGTNKQVNILQKQKMTIHHHKPIGGQVDQLGTNIPHQLQSGLITMNQQLNHSTHGMNALKHTLPGDRKSVV